MKAATLSLLVYHFIHLLSGKLKFEKVGGKRRFIDISQKPLWLINILTILLPIYRKSDGVAQGDGVSYYIPSC